MDELAFFYPDGHEAHFETGHPERPERVEAIRKALKNAGWWETACCVEPLSLPQEVLRGVHSAEYLSTLERACQRGQRLDLDTYTTPDSWRVALHSAGGAAAVAEAVWQRKARRGFALTRPPGHHATIRRGMGFCLLNNVALAAEHLLQGEGAQRLAIMDLDLHHGNGLQDIFYRRAEVFYLSTHQAPFYPLTGWIEERGAGPGFGTNANLPLPPRSGDQAFRSAMDEVILPLINGYQPEMLLVCVGFDTHWKDPIGSLLLTAQEYGRLVSNLVGWADAECQGRIALFLEGGYNLEAGAACAQAATAALLGQPWTDPLGPPPFRETQDWRPVMAEVKKVWGLR